MNDASESLFGQILLALFAGVVMSVPPLLVWGWVRWVKSAHQKTVFSILSLIGFSLANASAILAVGSALYAHAIGGFPFYDPLLLTICRWGAGISLAGTMFGSWGAWRPSPLRWHAPICGVGTLVFWLIAASTE